MTRALLLPSVRRAAPATSGLSDLSEIEHCTEREPRRAIYDLLNAVKSEITLAGTSAQSSDVLYRISSVDIV